jgi:hypothetical protein
MAGCIISGQTAAKKIIEGWGHKLDFYDYASLANAVYTGGPKGDHTKNTRNYFARCHSNIELTEDQCIILGAAVWAGLCNRYTG